MQTMELARISSMRITAVDTHQPFLDELLRRAQAAGVVDRVKTVNASMFSMRFDEQTFNAKMNRRTVLLHPQTLSCAVSVPGRLPC